VHASSLQQVLDKLRVLTRLLDTHTERVEWEHLSRVFPYFFLRYKRWGKKGKKNGYAVQCFDELVCTCSCSLEHEKRNE